MDLFRSLRRFLDAQFIDVYADTNAESSPRTSPWTFPINAGLFDVVDDFPTRPYPTIEMDVDQPKVFVIVISGDIKGPLN
jgi:hypothetical protein